MLASAFSPSWGAIAPLRRAGGSALPPHGGRACSAVLMLEAFATSAGAGQASEVNPPHGRRLDLRLARLWRACPPVAGVRLGQRQVKPPDGARLTRTLNRWPWVPAEDVTPSAVSL